MLSIGNIPIFSFIDGFLHEYSPCLVIISTLLVSYIIRKIMSVSSFVMNYEGGIIAGMIEIVFPYIKKSKFVSSKIDSETQELLEKTIESYAKNEVQERDIYALPEKGIPAEELLERLRSYHTNFGDHSYEEGYCSGAVYTSPDPKRNKVLVEAYSIFSDTNALYYELYPAVCKFEREIVRCTRDLMHGDSKNVKGLVTSGGTESLMLSIKAYREYYERKKPWIRNPEIVAMESIHAAVDKGCDLTRIKLVKVRIDRTTFTADPSTVEKYITKNTIAIYISAPCFPFGIIDDVEGIGRLAKKYNIGLHVDSCLGGFYCPFAYRLGLGIPKFDFLVEGVTSMSADTHKFAQAPKGTSVVLFKTKELRNCCFFVQLKWQGGLYATPSFGGTRSGGTIAGCWAALMINGMENYLKVSKEIYETVQVIKEGVKKIKGIKVAGDPQAMVVNIMSDEKVSKFSIFQVVDEMKNFGWHLQGTQNPQGFHFSVTPRSVRKGDVFLRDLEKCVEKVREDPKLHLKESASLYGIAGYAPKELLQVIGVGVMTYFCDGKEKHELLLGEEEEEEEEEEGEEDFDDEKKEK